MTDNYYPTLSVFVGKLKQDQKTDDVYTVSGRKYDRVFVKGEVKYFVGHEGGNIYGRKSDVAPNLRHWFGTIHRCLLWDWTGPYGVPVSDDKVRVMGVYGPYHRYGDA